MQLQTLIKTLALSLVLSSCAIKNVPFTSDLQDKYNFSKEHLKKIQFYTSAPITLTKIETEDNAAINKGKVLLVTKESSETIIIPANTPCVLVEMLDKTKFLFSFEYGEHRLLLFGSNAGGYYSLMAKNWKMKHGVIKYADKHYMTNNGDVFLTISSHSLRKLKNRTRTLGGRTI